MGKNASFFAELTTQERRTVGSLFTTVHDLVERTPSKNMLYLSIPINPTS
jgi:hypothetical protein